MSLVVWPSALPGASSGSLLVTPTSVTLEDPQASRALTWAVAGTRRWFGGHRPGTIVTDSAGGAVSRTTTRRSSVDSKPRPSLTRNVTAWVPIVRVGERATPVPRS